MMEDCFRDIYNIDAGYERTIGYCRAAFNTLEASTITEVKTTKEPGLCYTCGGPHFISAAQMIRVTIPSSKTRQPHS